MPVATAINLKPVFARAKQRADHVDAVFNTLLAYLESAAAKGNKIRREDKSKFYIDGPDNSDFNKKENRRKTGNYHVCLSLGVYTGCGPVQGFEIRRNGQVFIATDFIEGGAQPSPKFAFDIHQCPDPVEAVVRIIEFAQTFARQNDGFEDHSKCYAAMTQTTGNPPRIRRK